MPTLTLTWTKYTFQFPDIISEDRYQLYKNDFNLNDFNLKSTYWKDFRNKFIELAISGGVACLVFLPTNDFSGILAVIAIVYGAGVGYYILVSSILYQTNYVNKKTYLKILYKSITESDSYLNFCIMMSKKMFYR